MVLRFRKSDGQFRRSKKDDRNSSHRGVPLTSTAKLSSPLLLAFVLTVTSQPLTRVGRLIHGHGPRWVGGPTPHETVCQQME